MIYIRNHHWNYQLLFHSEKTPASFYLFEFGLVVKASLHCMKYSCFDELGFIYDTAFAFQAFFVF